MNDSIQYAILNSVTRKINNSILDSIQLTYGLGPNSWGVINGAVNRCVRDSVWTTVWDVLGELNKETNNE
jgi:hypothetical protein